MDISKIIAEGENALGISNAATAVVSDPTTVSKLVVTVEHIKDILTSVQAIVALFHKSKPIA